MPETSPAAPVGDGTLAELRRIVRDGGIRLGVDHAALFLFEGDEDPARRVVRFHLAGRRFDPPALHSPRLSREVRVFFGRVSRVEASDLRESDGPPGALGEHLRAAGVRALLSLPVRVGRRISGFLTFEMSAETRRWTAAERERAQEVVDRIGEVLDGRFPSGRVFDDGPARDPERDPGTPGPPAADPTSEAPPSEAATSDPGSSNGRADPAGAGTRELRARIPRLRPLEAAALVGRDLGEDLEEMLEVQEGFLRLLAPGRDADPELLAELHRLSRSLREGMAGIVRSARLESGHREVGDLNEIMASLTTGLVRRIGERVHLLIRPSAGALPVRVDPVLLGRALTHLVENARGASAPGSRIRVSWRRERVAARGRPGRDPSGSDSAVAVDRGAPEETEETLEVACIRVEDEGRGIRPGDLPWVFEAGFAPPDDEGTPGIGLATVQAIVEAHGGWVDLRSTPGSGTRAALHLPLVRDEGGAWGRPGSGASPDGARILVVDDRPERARFLRRVLGEAGYAVGEAASPEEAGRRAPEADLLLVSRGLWERAAQRDLRWAVEEGRRGPPVVLVEGVRTTASEPEAGPGARIRPPFDPDALVALVRDRLRGRLPE